jgi:mannose-6-phosphate isomerase-like protein (cupin superfamily)
MTNEAGSQIPIGAEWNILQMGVSQSEQWHEFFSIPSMSMGIYKLKAGEADLQSPHTVDEAYYIVSGQAKIQVEEFVYDCLPGKVIFVRKRAIHKFIEIEEDLTILVFFAPAEGSQAE